MDERHHTVDGSIGVEGERLDRFLAAREPDLSRSRIKRVIAEGGVTVAGRPATKAGQRVSAGDEIRLRLPPPVPADVAPEILPLDLRYEDASLVVLSKRAGMVVHPAPGHATGTLVAALLHHCDDLSGVGGALRPGIVHRLDRDTSGLLVVAKNDVAHRALAEQFAARTAYRRYLALVHGGARMPDRGRFQTLYGRHPHDRKRFSSRVRRGREAVTRWRLLLPGDGIHLLECKLETGRTHQIRVHLADYGHPVVADPLYAGRRCAPHPAARALNRQALHAYALGFRHPVREERLTFRDPPPDDVRAVLDAVWGERAVEDALAPLLEATDRDFE